MYTMWTRNMLQSIKRTTDNLNKSTTEMKNKEERRDDKMAIREVVSRSDATQGKISKCKTEEKKESRINFKFTVNENCNCCRTCSLKYPEYFHETDEGKAVGKDVTAKLDSLTASEIEKMCLAHAIKALKVAEPEKINEYKTEEKQESETYFKFTVNENCNCCRTCSLKYPEYFHETDEGKAVGKDVTAKLDSLTASEIEKMCLAHAIKALKVAEPEKINEYKTEEKQESETYFKFTVNKNCNCCGICSLKYPEYFHETDEGSAIGKDINAKLDSLTASEIESICPTHAIKASKAERLTKQLLAEAVEKLKECKISYPTASDIPFKQEEYSIPIPSASGEYRYDYSSDSSANSAARSEFDRKMYSQIDVLILKIITEYRIRYIKPYYSKEEADRSVYAACNKKAENILKEIAQMLQQEGQASDLPKDFCKVSFFPEKDTYWKMLNKGELLSDEMISTVRREFDSSSYSSLRDYESYWDTDDREVYAGMDRRGNTKYKDKYCYRNMRAAFQELAKDILNACYYKDKEIQDRAISLVKELILLYNKELEKILAPKIAYIERKAKLIKNVSGAEAVALKKYSKEMRTVWGHDELSVNGSTVDDKEVFIVDSPNGKTQFFYDGKVIRKRFISEGVIRNEVILENEQPHYSIIIGYKGTIVFESDWYLWQYNCDSGVLKKLDTDVYRFKTYKNKIFYSTLDNIHRTDYDRFAAGSIKYCNADGSDIRTLLWTRYGNGLIFLKAVDDEYIYYETVGRESISGKVSWKGN